VVYVDHNEKQLSHCKQIVDEWQQQLQLPGETAFKQVLKNKMV